MLLLCAKDFRKRNRWSIQRKEYNQIMCVASDGSWPMNKFIWIMIDCHKDPLSIKVVICYLVLHWSYKLNLTILSIKMNPLPIRVL